MLLIFSVLFFWILLLVRFRFLVTLTFFGDTFLFVSVEFDFAVEFNFPIEAGNTFGFDTSIILVPLAEATDV